MKKVHVNGAAIEPQEIQARLERMMRFYAAQGVPQEAFRDHLDEFVAAAQEQAVSARLLSQEAASKGQTEAEFIAALVKDLPAPSEADAEKYYKENEESFVTPPEVRASHILVKTEGLDDDGKARAKAKLEGILARVKGEINVEAAFADAAKTDSDCPSGQQGGDLGWFRRGMMVPEFDAASFEMKEGELSGVIETTFGYHVILKTGAREGSKQPFAACKEAILEGLASEARDQTITTFVAGLREKAKIEVVDVKD